MWFKCRIPSFTCITWNTAEHRISDGAITYLRLATKNIFWKIKILSKDLYWKSQPNKLFFVRNQNLLKDFLHSNSMNRVLDTAKKNVNCNADICPTGSVLRS